MWKFAFRAAGLVAFSLLFSGIAQAKDGPIEILLSQVNLDLSNPEATAKKIRDKNFKSNDPSMRSRIYVLNDGTRVKLVGRKFNKSTNIDKIRVTYPIDGSAYKKSYAALAESFGNPSAKRPDILVWRLDNDKNSSTQSKTIKIIAGENKAKKHTIMADRQRGGKGNNHRPAAPKTAFATPRNASARQLRPTERD